MGKERNMTNVTSVAAADFVRVVTSAGASVKGTMENFAKSLLTTAFSGLSLGGSQQSVKDALDSLNSNSDQNLTTSYASEMTCFKRGNVGFLRIRDPKGLASGTSTTVATLPVGYRPEANINHYLPTRGSSYSAGVGVIIGANGSIDLYNYTSSTGTINAQGIIAYPLKV